MFGLQTKSIMDVMVFSGVVNYSRVPREIEKQCLYNFLGGEGGKQDALWEMGKGLMG